MANGYLYPGRVVKLDPNSGGPIVQIPLLGGDVLWGPFDDSCVPDLQVGDRVICGTLGASANTVQILGRTPGRRASVEQVEGLPAILSAYDTRLDAVELDNTTDQAVLNDHGIRITAAETKNTQQDGRLDLVESTNSQQNTRLTNTEAVANAAAPASTLATLRADTAGKVTTKGDLLAATASGVLARQPAPANGLTLVGDSAQATGWAAKDVLGMPKALPGAVAPTRYIGALSVPGPPVAPLVGAVGDYVIDSAQHVWVCSVAGTPGTWVSRTAEQAARLAAQEAYEHYGWQGTGSCNNGDSPQVTGWPTAGANNSTRMASPNGTGQVVLGRAGRWTLRMGAYSDHGADGYTQVWMNWPGGAIRPLSDIVDGRWHGGGFGGAGQSNQWATWTGWVTAAEAAIPIKMFIYQVNRSATAVAFTYYCSFEYMGGAA